MELALTHLGTPVLHFPTAIGADVPTYNLPGSSTELNFTPDSLSGIFLGKITKWNDPALQVPNPGIKLPDKSIIVVHRSDGSGTTSILTNCLSKVNSTWSTRYGAGVNVKWPAGIGQDGSEAILEMVKSNPGTIGYLELSYATKAGMPVATIQNRAGEFVAPSPASASVALNASIDSLLKDLRTPIVDPPANAKGAYPITGISYFLIRKDNKTSDGEQAAFKDFVTYALTTGQHVAEELSYAKLPQPIRLFLPFALFVDVFLMDSRPPFAADHEVNGSVKTVTSHCPF